MKVFGTLGLALLMVLGCGSGTQPCRDAGTSADGFSDGRPGDSADPARFEGCVPRCLAEVFARCLVPAGPCQQEVMPTGESTSLTLACHPEAITTTTPSSRMGSVSVFADGGICYTQGRTLASEGFYVVQYTYFKASATYATIRLDGPDYQTGMAYCGTDVTNGQPFSFADPKCAFLKNGIAYEDPTTQCTEGSCPVPWGL